MNKAIIIGNLTKNPELRTTQSGISICTFRVAVSRPHKRDETDYLNVVTWRGLAENCAKYLAKGRKVAVIGSIQTRDYDASDGTKRYITEIVADDVEFLSPKNETASERTFDKSPETEFEDDFEPLDDSDMPF